MAKEKVKEIDSITFEEKCKICGKAITKCRIKSNIGTKKKLDLAERECPKCGSRYIIKDKKIIVLSVKL